jgi:hypothetical protein
MINHYFFSLIFSRAVIFMVYADNYKNTNLSPPCGVEAPSFPLSWRVNHSGAGVSDQFSAVKLPYSFLRARGSVYPDCLAPPKPPEWFTLHQELLDRLRGKKWFGECIDRAYERVQETARSHGLDSGLGR